MLSKFIAKTALATVLAATALSPALARHHRVHHPRAHRLVGACAKPGGRCISDCDQLNWCQVYACTNGKSTPIPFWRCFQPSGMCFAPHC